MSCRLAGSILSRHLIRQSQELRTGCLYFCAVFKESASLSSIEVEGGAGGGDVLCGTVEAAYGGDKAYGTIGGVDGSAICGTVGGADGSGKAYATEGGASGTDKACGTEGGAGGIHGGCGTRCAVASDNSYDMGGAGEDDNA